MQLLFIGLLGFSMVGCHGCKDPVEDPCEGVEEVAADFKMEYSLGLNEDRKWFEADTILKYRYVRFKALGDYDSVRWKIGLDPRTFSEKVFSLQFDNPDVIQVRMIGFKKPNLDCFPNDNGIDTISKQLVIVPKEEALVLGDYKGYFLSEPDSSFTLMIKWDTGLPYIHELPKGCVHSPVQGLITAGYKNFKMAKFDTGGPCPFPKGWGVLKDDTLKVDFNYTSNVGYFEDTFIGIKQ